MFCSKCGKEIADDSKFCLYCGNQIQPNMPDQTDNTEQYHKAKREYFLNNIYDGQYNYQKIHSGSLTSLICVGVYLLCYIALIVFGTLQDVTPEETTSGGISITISQSNGIAANVTAICFLLSLLASLVIIVFSILLLRRRLIRPAAIVSFVSSIVYLATSLVFLMNGCCMIILIVFPVICLKGTITTLTGLGK